MRYKIKIRDDECDSFITRIEPHSDYLSYTVIGKNLSVKTLLGVDDGVIWISFPAKEVSCTLACPDDLFWNTEKLSYILNSDKEGCAIARSVQELKHLVKTLEIK